MGQQTADITFGTCLYQLFMCMWGFFLSGAKLCTEILFQHKFYYYILAQVQLRHKDHRPQIIHLGLQPTTSE